MGMPLLVSSAYAALYLRAAGLSAEQTLEGTGLTEAEMLGNDFINARQMIRLIENIEHSGAKPGWAARIGNQLNVSTHGPLGFAALSAPTLGAALQVMAEFHAVRISTLRVDLQQRGNRYRFALQDLTGSSLYAQRSIEPTLRVLEVLIETIVGHPASDNVLISFTQPAPDYAAVLEDVYSAPCEFGSSHTAISIPASWRHIRSPLHDEASYRANIAKCREIMVRLDDSQDAIQQVRNIFASHFDRVLVGHTDHPAPPGLEIIAAQLHLTPRTLIRRLKRQGSAYQVLLDKARMDVADTLLQQAKLSVADVGEKLGYSDPANFGRAFKKWTGVSPAAWRRGK